jgi:aspartate aminotransferase
MKQNLSTRVLGMNESATLKMARLARELSDTGVEVISLSLGEPDFDTPEFIKEAAWDALKKGFTKYTPVPGLPELRDTIVKKFKRDNNLVFNPSQIVVSNGAKQTIANLAMALLNEDDEAILFAPYWVSYFDIINMIGGKAVPIATSVEDDFKVRPSQLEAAISEKTKFVLFSSPCNPTGSVYSEKELRELAEILENYPNAVIISDEIYEYINFTDTHFSIGQIESIADRVVTVNGFSKGFAMTGWRLGYMGAPQWLADACVKIQGQFTSGATAFGQKAGVSALNAGSDAAVEMKQAYFERKEMARKKLAEIDGVKVNNPQGAFYIFPDISAYLGKSIGSNTINNSDEMAAFLLTEAHVATVSGAAFGSPECIRLSFAASFQEISTAIDRIAEALKKLKSR